MDKNMKVLIVDDFATMRKILSSMLEKVGIEIIHEADSAQTAWDMLQKDRYNLVISDYNMPGMTGMELLAKIRESETLKNQKFIMLTAENDKEILMSGKTLNLDAYILKPFKLEVLTEKLNSINWYK